MNRAVGTIAGIACCIVLAAGYSAGPGTADEPAASPGPEIAEAEMPAVEREGLLGGLEAALKLRDYYLKSHANRERQIYWTTIAAENGSAMGQYSLGFNLIASTDQKDKIRGIFWLRKAAAGGVELARGVLKAMGQSQ